MCNNITEANWSGVVRNVHTRMAEHIRPYIASISRTDDDQSSEAHGSGVYLEFKERSYLLTCEHVVRAYQQGYRIAHLPKAGSNYCAFNNPWFPDPYPVDLALTYIDPRVWSEGEKLGFPVSRIATNHHVADHELLMLCGYPGAASYFSRFSGEPVLDSRLIPYTARETALPTGFDPGIHFALHYEMTLAESVDEGSAKLPEPPGFSGSPIWDTGFVASNCSKDWTPEQARIIGIATRWIEEHSCIVATKGSKVREFLLENVRNDVAFHHWIARGKPEDDQADIEYARKMVPNLSSTCET